MADCMFRGLHPDREPRTATCVWIQSASGEELLLCDDCRAEWLKDVIQGLCPMPRLIARVPEDWDMEDVPFEHG